MRALGWLLVGLALGTAAWWWNRPGPPVEVAPAAAPEESPEAPAAPAAPPRIAPAEEPAPATLAPMRLVGCPGLEAQPIGPSLADAANVLTAELWDRTRALLRDGSTSPLLRDGLRALARGEDERAIPLLRDAPDRVQDGFDLAAAAAFASVIRALAEEGDTGAALARLVSVDREGLAPVAEALLARQRGDDTAELEALTRALRRRDDPAVAFALASSAARDGDSATALEALDAYLEAFPDDPWAVTMRPKIASRARLEAPMGELRRDGITLRYAPSFDQAQAVSVLDQVVGSLEDAARLLGAPRRPRLTVVIYADRMEYSTATCGPGWSGALFDGSLRLDGSTHPRQLPVAVRHESLHAQLAAVAPRAPLWLHEGLAQHFQGQRPPALERTLELMARQRTYVPFPSLEGSFVVIEDGQSARFAYHQSYAMVAAILEREGEAAVRRVVQHLKGDGDPRQALEVMSGRPFTGDDLLGWIERRGP